MPDAGSISVDYEFIDEKILFVYKYMFNSKENLIISLFKNSSIARVVIVCVRVLLRFTLSKITYYVSSSHAII